MGIKKQASYRDYWCSLPQLNDRYISSQMTVNRFGWFLSHVHLNDNSLQPNPGDPNFHKLYKVRPILSELLERFKKRKNPTCDLSVDESMVKFTGRSTLKQYMPLKAIRRGYKVWMLNDKTKYTHHFQIYTGKTGQKTETDLGGRVVKDLTSEYTGHHHKLLFDNYFASVPLMKHLYDNQIYACATIRSDRKYLPTLEDAKNMKRGDFDYSVSEGNVIYYRWMDNKVVHLISTFHQPEKVSTVKRKLKDGSKVDVTCPQVLKDYNQNMNNVDVFDQLKSSYAIDRRSKKWWHRIFWHFLDAALVNSYIL